MEKVETTIIRKSFSRATSRYLHFWIWTRFSWKHWFSILLDTFEERDESIPRVLREKAPILSAVSHTRDLDIKIGHSGLYHQKEKSLLNRKVKTNFGSFVQNSLQKAFTGRRSDTKILSLSRNLEKLGIEKSRNFKLREKLQNFTIRCRIWRWIQWYQNQIHSYFRSGDIFNLRYFSSKNWAKSKSKRNKGCVCVYITEICLPHNFCSRHLSLPRLGQRKAMDNSYRPIIFWNFLDVVKVA